MLDYTNRQLEDMIEAVKERLGALANRVTDLDREVIRRFADLEREVARLQDQVTFLAGKNEDNDEDENDPELVAEFEKLLRESDKKTA